MKLKFMTMSGEDKRYVCKDCLYLSLDSAGNYICKRPDGTGNHKASPNVGACSQFELYKKED